MFLHGAATEIDIAAFTNGTKTLEHHAQRVDAIVTAGATFVLAVLGQRFGKCQFAEFRFVAWQVRNIRRWRRNGFAKQRSHDPVTSLDGTRSQTRCVLCEEDRHGKQSAAGEYLCPKRSSIHSLQIESSVIP